ncbi:conserved protein of unknown function [Ectopseudomonas oleovorans]|uniref:Uncharacterized protein n=1 Tax=Ectopseudomonas oleovorans TaxID=301 RepID=A0A653B036_ECTOL|nr:conserved protein of unknown function [Pseudomonas oleovorans]
MHDCLRCHCCVEAGPQCSFTLREIERCGPAFAWHWPTLGLFSCLRRVPPSLARVRHASVCPPDVHLSHLPGPAGHGRAGRRAVPGP